MKDEMDPMAVSDVNIHVVPEERTKLKALLSINPNYFGTVEGSDFQPVVAISGDTAYEELQCVSFNPEQSLLEAVVSVKRPFGYGGNLCQDGSYEYVKFFLDYGAGWVDCGVASIAVHDIPNGIDCFDDPRLPLSYSATLKVDPTRNWCQTPVLPKVRAILSWQVIPAGATFRPVWGDVHDCTVQIAPRHPIVLDVISLLSSSLEMDVKLPDDLAYAGPIPLPGPGPEELGLAALAQMYSQPTMASSEHVGAHARGHTAVPAHRFGFAHLAQAQSSAAISPEFVAQNIASWAEAGLDWLDAAAAINEVDADVSYEQLECLGLDNNLERLTATFRVKRPSGYNGGLCQKGSREFVSFWADWDNDCSWSYIGTTSVGVHDINPLPEGGLCYAAVLQVDLTHHRQSCSKPKVVRVRAVLSWNTPPSTVNPDAIPTWGNRIDTHVQIAPGPVVPPGTVKPIIGFLGGIPISLIFTGSGVTMPTAHFALLGGGQPADPDSAGRGCPFARRVAVQGPAFPGYSYRVQVKRASDPAFAWQTVNNPFTVWDETGTISTLQTPVGEYFAYMPHTVNSFNILAEWDTTGDDLWEVKLDILGVAGVAQHKLQLHNSGPEATIDIDILAGNCGKFPVGTVLSGHFVARDQYLARYELNTAPFSPPPGALTPVTPIYTQTAPAPGGNPWELKTSKMKPCGYIIGVSVTSRAIYNSSPSYTTAWGSAGFCLEAV